MAPERASQPLPGALADATPLRGALEWLAAVAVGAYLAAVMVILVATRQVNPGVSFVRLVRASLGPPQSGVLSGFRAETGHCYRVTVPARMISDAEGHSRVRVFEDRRPLGEAHRPIDEVRRLGGGRYSHWQGEVFMSTSDNTDPRSNGRVYTYSE